MTEPSARKGLLAAALLTGAGVAFSGTTQSWLGGVLLIIGWVVFVGALHGFGRAASRPRSE